MYLDGNHDFEPVLHDLELYWPKVGRGERGRQAPKLFLSFFRYHTVLRSTPSPQS